MISGSIGFAIAAGMVFIFLLARGFWLRTHNRRIEDAHNRRIAAKYVEKDRREKEWDQGKRN